MQLAYSSNAYTRGDLVSALRSIAELGYQGAEILCDRPHWFPGEVPDSDIDNIARIVDELGLGISNLNANTANGYFQPLPPENVFEPALSNPDPEMRQWRKNYSIEAIRLAHRIGASCISVTSGRPTPGCSPDTSLDYFIESLKTICEEAARYDVRIGIEYEPGLLVERATEVMEVVDRVGSPLLGVNFDIGHSFLHHEDPRSTVQLLAGRIWNVHVEDMKRQKHFHLVPGEGDLPFSEYFDALREIGYNGYLTVELYSYPEQPVEVGHRARDYLSRILQQT